MAKKLNVILDIDETFVQYVGVDEWDALPEETKARYTIEGKSESGLFILRPHFDEFFKFLFDNCKTVNLWTWSDKPYAKGVAAIIREHNINWKINNVWADTDVDASIELYGRNKDLNYIWYELGVFHPCDTILIDDLKDNTQNKSNIKNSIQLKAFHPLGEKLSKAERIELKSKGRLRTGVYTDFSNDDTLVRVMDVLRKVMSNPDFCSEGDMPHPFEESTTVLGGKRNRTIRRKHRRRSTRKSRR